MEQQIKRLKTYLKLADEYLFYPPDKENAFINLSERGLYYSDENKELKCHFCKFCKKIEKKDLQDQTQHSCSARFEKDNNNIPISKKSDEKVLAEFTKRYETDYTYYERCQESNEGLSEPLVKAKLPLPRGSRLEVVEDVAAHPNVQSVQSTHNRVEDHAYPVPCEQTCEIDTAFTDTSDVLLTNPTLRLDSSLSSSIVKCYERLRSAGFIRLGNCIYCPTCRVEISDSEWLMASDFDPFAVHKQFQPTCPFIQKIYYEDGIPLSGRSIIHSRIL